MDGTTVKRRAARAEQALVEAAAALLRELDADARPAVLDLLVDQHVDALARIRPNMTADQLTGRALAYRNAVKQHVAESA